MFAALWVKQQVPFASLKVWEKSLCSRGVHKHPVGLKSRNACCNPAEWAEKQWCANWLVCADCPKHRVLKFRGRAWNKAIPWIIICKSGIQNICSNCISEYAGTVLAQRRNTGTASQGAKWQGMTGLFPKEQARNEGRLIQTPGSPFRYTPLCALNAKWAITFLFLTNLGRARGRCGF